MSKPGKRKRSGGASEAAGWRFDRPANQPGLGSSHETALGGGRLGIRQTTAGDFVLVHPPCVEERFDDYSEGLEVWAAGEPDEAREILLHALEGCASNLWIHTALGQLALQAGDNPSLARGHFGYAFELVRAAIPPGFTGRLARTEAANRPLYEAVEGLIAALLRLGQMVEAEEIRRIVESWSCGTAPQE